MDKQQDGHCKDMQEDWEHLAWDLEDDYGKLIAQVDCTSDGGRILCDEMHVSHYPTLKYGNPIHLSNYDSQARDYVDLKHHAKKNLEPTCSVARLDLCSYDEREEIEEAMELSDEELEEKINLEEAIIEEAQREFHETVARLKLAHQALVKQRMEDDKNIAESGLGLLKSVKKHFVQQREGLSLPLEDEEDEESIPTQNLDN